MGNPESPKFDGCPMDSHFIGHGLLRTVFEITLARPEGSTPATIVSTNTKILKNHQNNFILLFYSLVYNKSTACTVHVLYVVAKALDFLILVPIKKIRLFSLP